MSADSFLYLKALHIIFVVTWFSGLFYIVRLFIYHVEAEERPKEHRQLLQAQFKVMERRLWYGITWPSAVLTLIFGPALATQYLPLSDHPWLLAKLCLVFLLFVYHLACGRIFRALAQDQVRHTGNQLRAWNEVATLFLFAIVFLAVLKNLLNMGLALAGMTLLSLLLFLGIKLYRIKRLSQ